MRDGWKRVALKTVATLDIDRVAVVAGQRYPVAGVLNGGKGLFSRESIDASETNYPALHRLRTGQLVMRKLTAWEGPITTVEDNYDGYFVSPEFPTFTLDRVALEPSYMRLVCQTPALWEAMKNTSTGTVQRRKRVSPSALLSIELDLPPLKEQRRIVDLVAAIDRVIAAAAVQGAATKTALRVVREDLLLDGIAVPLEQLCSIDSQLVDPTREEYRNLPHLGVDRIESGSGRCLPCLTALEDGVTSGKFLFTPDDVVVAKIRPNLRKATWPQFTGLASADAYPLRTKTGIETGYLLELLLSDGFVAQAVACSGRTKMPKINRAELFSIRVPLVTHDQQRKAVGVLAALRETRDANRSVEEHAQSLRDSVMQNLLTGQHEIPEAYDVLLESA